MMAVWQRLKKKKKSEASSVNKSKNSNSSSATTTTTATTTATEESLSSLFFQSHALLLCNVPILVLVVVASLDHADKSLLASSFPVLQRTLGLSVQTLGYFSLFSNVSYALSLPFWSYLLHQHGLGQIHVLLSTACYCWGLATIGIAMSGSSILGQALFRSLVGAALGSILPLSQTLLVELVRPAMRGRAFGFMGFCENVAGTLAAASLVYVDDRHWTIPYYCLGILSLLMAVVARKHLNPAHIVLLNDKNKNSSHGAKRKTIDNIHFHDDNNNDYENENFQLQQHQPQLSFREIVERIARLPAFICMVAQGVFGGTPWEMMSFLLLLLNWRGFDKRQIVAIQFSMGISRMFGYWLGGILGDWAEARFAHAGRAAAAAAAGAGAGAGAGGAAGVQGRIGVAFISVAGGIPLYGLFLFAKDFHWAILWINLFMFVGTWTPSAALRPLCAALTRNASERAQIVSMWIVLERLSGAVFGAPLVGYLTSRMLSREEQQETGMSQEKAAALAWNLFLLSTLFWSICAFFWMVMAFTMKGQKLDIFYRQENEEKERSVESRMELAALDPEK